MSEPTPPSTVKSLLNGCGLFVACAIGTGVSAFAANIGAGIGGFTNGTYGLGTIYIGFLGLVAGFILTIASIIYAKIKYPDDQENVYAFPLFAVPIVILIGSAIIYPLASAIGGYQSRKKYEYQEASQAAYDTLYKQLKTNPEIAIQENWAQGDYEHALAFEASWYDAEVPYTAEQLGRIYSTNPQAYQVFLHPAATTEFLNSHFDAAFKEKRNALDYIVRNPKTPVQLIRKVAYAPYQEIYPRTLRKAREIITAHDHPDSSGGNEK